MSTNRRIRSLEHRQSEAVAEVQRAKIAATESWTKFQIEMSALHTKLVCSSPDLESLGREVGELRVSLDKIDSSSIALEVALRKLDELSPNGEYCYKYVTLEPGFSIEKAKKEWEHVRKVLPVSQKALEDYHILVMQQSAMRNMDQEGNR